MSYTLLSKSVSKPAKPTVVADGEDIASASCVETFVIGRAAESRRIFQRSKYASKVSSSQSCHGKANVSQTCIANINVSSDRHQCIRKRQKDETIVID